MGLKLVRIGDREGRPYHIRLRFSRRWCNGDTSRWLGEPSWLCKQGCSGPHPLPPLHQRWRGGRGAGAWLLGLLATKYGADVVHLHHIFGFSPVLFDTTIRLAYNRSIKLHRAYDKGEGP